MKSLYISKTFYFAVAQAVAAVLAAFLSDNPTLATVGWVAMVKSLVDVYLRFVTTQPVKI